MSSSISISLVLYDTETGEKVRDAKSLSFKKANSGEFTPPSVIRMFADGARKIENVRIGIIGSSGEITGSGDANDDGSVPSGDAGIEHAKSFQQRTELESFFPGMNETGLSSGGNLVSVNTLTENSTEYVYLSVKIPDGSRGGFVKYKWFFDMA